MNHLTGPGMDISTLVSEAVQEAVHAASELEVHPWEPAEHMVNAENICAAEAMEDSECSSTPLVSDKIGDNTLRPTQLCGSGKDTILEIPGQPAASIRLHKAKVRALERELHAARAALDARSSEIKELRQQYFDIKSEKMTSFRAVSGLEQQVNKLQKQLQESRAQVAAKDALLRQYKEDSSAGARDKRRSEAESRAQNARMNRALDEVQRFRKQLEDVKHVAAVQGSVTQAEYGHVMAENKRLERQRSELIAAFKKQSKLINVLKKQKIHVETARLLQFTEEEFVTALH